jgi:orotate phosphoribosyltransferase
MCLIFPAYRQSGCILTLHHKTLMTNLGSDIFAAMNIQLHDPASSRDIAAELLKVEAIKLRPTDPFTWASGWKSPIYCDNRVSLSFPATRTKIKLALVDLVRKHFSQAEAIAGVATAGIPQGALVAEELGLPFLYVRSQAKSHGLSNQIEGRAVSGQKVVVVEDLVSTGGSSLVAVEALRAAGVEVLGMAAIFTYAFGVAEENFKKADVQLVVLSDYPTLVNSANFDAGTTALLNQWREKPEAWGK